MEQNIRYKGLSLTPDDLAAENGTLALSANCELHDSALRPSVIHGTELTGKLTYTRTDVVVNSTTTTETKVCTLLYVHKTASYTHFIAVCPAFSDETHTTLHWFDEDGAHGGVISDFDYTQYSSDDSLVSDPASIIQVESIGNTLIVLATNGKHYILWKTVDGNSDYHYLGQQPPFVQLSFSLQTVWPQQYDRSTIDTDGDATEGSFYTAYRKTAYNASDDYFEADDNGGFFKTDEIRSNITQEAWALINQTHDYITKSGYFYTNFLVRYCYRLYDGTMFMHSAPIFIPAGMPNSVQVGFVNRGYYTYTGDISVTDYAGHRTSASGKLLLSYMPVSAPLRFKCDSAAAYTSLKENWSDVIMSIDVFVSPQFLKVQDTDVVKTVSAFETINGIYCDIGTDKVPVAKAFDPDSIPYKLDLPEIPDDVYFQKIRDNATFYKVKSFPLEKYNLNSYTSYRELNVKDVLSSLTEQELMTDDYKSHNILLPVTDANGNALSKLYVYNSRLNISAIRERLFSGFTLQGGLIPPCSSDEIDGTVTVNSIYYTLSTEDGKKYVSCPVGNTTVSIFALCHTLYFYPDTRAVMVTINYTEDSTQKYVNIPLQPCLSLNGAVMQTDGVWEYHTLSGTSGSSIPTIDNIAPAYNKIYTSSSGNPFHFPPESIYTVGTGTILGIAATTRAISQGQFGQYPLMALATDGVWALDVSATGTFSAVHPISREVCSNPKSICQLDQQIVFATVRGLSVVTEQNVTSISAALDGIYKDMATIAPGLADYFANATAMTSYDDAIQQLLSFTDAPIDYFQESKVVYDFANNRLLVYQTPTTAQISAEKHPIYVYSIKDGTWSTMVTTPLLTAVNGYPHPYIENTDGTVTRLDQKYPFDDSTTYPTLIISRALNFGDAMYTIGDLIHNRMMSGTTIIFFYGSNDLVTWHYIGRTNQRKMYYLPGRAYRYYRFAIFNAMTPGEVYISTSFNVKEKFGKL